MVRLSGRASSTRRSGGRRLWTSTTAAPTTSWWEGSATRRVSSGLRRDLESLTVSRNSVAHLPDEIGDLSRLWLPDFASNELTPAIGRSSRLTTLSCSGNRISRLPDENTALTMSGQLSLRKFLDIDEQSPAVQAWLTDRRRRNGDEMFPIAKRTANESRPGFRCPRWFVACVPCNGFVGT